MFEDAEGTASIPLKYHRTDSMYSVLLTLYLYLRQLGQANSSTLGSQIYHQRHKHVEKRSKRQPRRELFLFRFSALGGEPPAPVTPRGPFFFDVALRLEHRKGDKMQIRWKNNIDSNSALDVVN